MPDRLLLASSSPRRAELLARSGFTFEVIAADGDETPLADVSPRENAVVIARRKADAASRARALAAGEVLLAADTLVVAGEEILGKPENDQDAARMLAMLSGVPHRVITGFVVRRGDGRDASGAVTTQVHFRSLAAREIDAYVRTGEPRGKAGAYAIQGIGACLVRSITGSYSNVVGLPLVEVIEALASLSDLRPFAVELKA